jgi:hypothetical protein
MLTDKEAEEIRRRLAAGLRGPVLIKCPPRYRSRYRSSVTIPETPA